MKRPLKTFLMSFYLCTPFAKYFYRYPYMFTPSQLIVIANLAIEASKAGNTFYEVGCAYGDTAVFLKKLLDEHGVDANYTVIDTFDGFLPNHLEYEINERHVTPAIRYDFAINKLKWVKRRFERNRVSINVFAQDACSFNFGMGKQIAFCLLDVDLYLPIADLLPKLYDNMIDGGILIVDDCDKTHPRWNGAHQAFIEFVEKRKIRYEIALHKLGIIRK